MLEHKNIFGIKMAVATILLFSALFLFIVSMAFLFKEIKKVIKNWNKGRHKARSCMQAMFLNSICLAICYFLGKYVNLGLFFSNKEIIHLGLERVVIVYIVINIVFNVLICKYICAEAGVQKNG